MWQKHRKRIWLAVGAFGFGALGGSGVLFSGKGDLFSQGGGIETSAVAPSDAVPTNPYIAEVEAAGPEQFPDLYRRLSPGDGQELAKVLAFRALTRRWVNHDPDELLNFHLNNGPGYDDSVFIEWIKHDATGFIQWTETASNEEFLLKGLRCLARESPGLAMDIARNHLVFKDRFEGFHADQLILELAKNDPREALDFLAVMRGIQAGKDTEALKGTRFDPGFVSFNGDFERQWARQNSETALEWADSLRGDPDHSLSIGVVLGNYALQDFEGAVEKYRELRQEVGGLMRVVIIEMSKQDPAAAVLFASRFGNSGVSKERILDAARKLGGSEEIIQVCSEITDPEIRDAVRAQALRDWGNRSIRDGYDWICSEFEGSERNHWLSLLGKGIGSVQFENAMRFSENIGNREEQGVFRRNLVSGLAKVYPNRALKTARDSDDSELYIETLESSLYSNLKSGIWSLREMGEMLSELPEGKSGAQVAGDLAEHWWKTDPEGAVTWIESVENPVHRLAGIEKTIEGMAEETPEKATDWSWKMADRVGQDRDTVFKFLIEEIRERKPAEAFLIANQVVDENMRTEMARRSIDVWRMRDPQSSGWAVENSGGLSEREKKRIQARIYGFDPKLK